MPEKYKTSHSHLLLLGGGLLHRLLLDMLRNLFFTLLRSCSLGFLGGVLSALLLELSSLRVVVGREYSLVF